MLTRLTTFIFLMMICFLQVIQCQVGPTIYTPANNDTVNPGSTIPITFGYQNLGTGAVAVNISLWQDSAATQKIQDVTTNYQLPPNNSSGTHVDFTTNATYNWNVPHGMNFSFYLTVTEITEAELGNYTLQSFPIMLHPSAAWAVLPNLILVLSLALAVLTYQV
ncbi:uncharacterized protein BX664DRAFT_323919 [Halteromyces radiatus]|uniref:uncharacterized protein n=1 Tax=Halteromyces radiatus TaxID=101107 RepID=UPI00221E4B84|nr:uncharacterized protein BX664DRAFT_323919 [Halteromyces radiatus]KAI8096405.1 hypothetical protein BX664DRAFT_323919 [Halteromyces radiatus]